MTMQLKSNRVILASLCALALQGVSFASGSDSFSSNSSATGQYNAGKQVYAEKLMCQGCMFAGQALNKDIAMKIVSDAKATEKLSEQERDALMQYAKKRFGL
jgi:hypothetical protein